MKRSSKGQAPQWHTELEGILRLIPGYDPWLQKGDSWLDHEAARRAIEFIEECLHHIEGTLAGKPFLLEPWEKAIVGNLFGWKRRDEQGRVVRRYRELFLLVPRKNGKMLAMDTPLPTPGGWTTIGEVKAGECLLDERGEICRVRAVHPVDPHPESYLVRFSNGEEIKACGDHLWLTTARIDTPGTLSSERKTELLSRRRLGQCLLKRLRTTREIFETQTAGPRRDRNHCVALAGELNLPSKAFPVDPYVLGVWLGDGDKGTARITCAKADLELCDHLRAAGIKAEICSYRQTDTVVTIRIGGIETCPRGHDVGEYSGQHCLACARAIRRARRRGEPMPPVTHKCLQEKLRDLGTLNQKHIPAEYLRGSRDQRLALLQGLMDTDGCVSKAGRCEFATSNPGLVEPVRELISTLSIKSTVEERATRATRGGERFRSWRITFNTTLPVFRLARKLKRLKTKLARSRTVQIVSVKRIEPEPMRCITVDSPSGLYLCGRTMLPTHNTPLAAAICLYVLFCDGEAGAQIVSSAGDREQAAILFRHAKGMVRAEPELEGRADIYDGKSGQGGFRTIVLRSDPGSTYRVISADADTKHGGNLHLVLIDELHVQNDRELVDVLTTGTASANRAQPLIIYITTSDYDRPSICNEKYDQAARVRDNKGDEAAPGFDPAFLPVMYEAKLGEDWTQPEVWQKANPNLGVSVSLDYLRRECKKAQEIPGYENTFKRLHLNMKTTGDVRWLSMEAWDRSGGAINARDAVKWREEMESRLAGRRCFKGLDLSSKIDLTADVNVFPPVPEDPLWYLLPRFFAPEERARIRQKTDKVPYEVWAKQGFLTLTSGDVVDYDWVKDSIQRDCRKFKVEAIAYDPWSATQIALQLAAEGLPMVEFGQGFKSMSEPAKELEKLVVSGRLGHGANPVLRWMAGNASAEIDPAGNVKPSKKKSNERIDGIVGTVMGIGRAILTPVAAESVYENRGVRTV